ncbi:UDP-N-acetylmuramoyl-L-alanyl-D-glutamate--2,6-diaminopimelate ligase [Desulforegula conservatrix]|uniref:UDP-N-acetylmuramoyl-L-alanyl-D-glutamate--2, 6-diaminopimelate ligase n=1 Tax=Desulforegula conservatrix TaxID=153026 RepID=UPI0003FD09F2|nr:UDP-N-acetylmuramoyl-L-alanyl-D-glutamate--2,6-diaminopimelate ligase [Desulforegula conservatrix]
MKLTQLLPFADREISGLHHVAGEGPEITSLHHQSGKVKKGGLFAAFRGGLTDGHKYIAHAIEMGASAILAEKFVETGDIPLVLVKNTRKALSRVSAAFHNYPAKRLKLIGVTGTNGKTTTAHIIEHILVTAGIKTGNIGTVNCHYGDIILDTSMTTPEPPELHGFLAEMADAGVTHVVMEVSSHAIDLYRVKDCIFDVAVFTNLTQDHLDYHGTIDDYWECKEKFIRGVAAGSWGKDRAMAVINCDDRRGEGLLNSLLKEIHSGSPPLISTGTGIDWMIRPGNVKADINGLRGTISTPEETFAFSTSLVGMHNLENILNSVGACIASGIPCEIIKKGIETFSAVPGRLERVPNNSKRFIFVDYAHTPDALEKALHTLSAAKKERLICIFGCGGDRDKTKRPIMGGISACIADITLITSDNPRTEDASAIIKDIEKGLPESIKIIGANELKTASKGIFIEIDRAKAIERAIASSNPGDIILIAGKGHEDYQIIGKEKIHFDDREEALKALEKYSIM